MERLQRVRMHLPERLSSCLRVRTPVSQRTQRGPSEREIARPSAWNHRHFQDSLRKRLWPSHNSETESIERQVTQHRLGRTYRVFDRAHTRVQKAPLRSHSSDNAGPIVNFGRTFPVTPRQWCKSRRRFFKCTRQLWHGPVLSGQPVRLRAGRKNFPLRTAKSTGQLRPAQATFPVKRPQTPAKARRSRQSDHRPGQEQRPTPLPSNAVEPELDTWAAIFLPNFQALVLPPGLVTWASSRRPFSVRLGSLNFVRERCDM